MKISVVMTTCNGGKYLEQQIQSILSQTLPPIEFIVCDDCSTDGTVAILEKYQQLQQLTYVVNDHRLGLIDNFKKAVSLAATDNYIALSDQDDQWLPGKLERSVALFRKMDPNLPCMVHTDLILVDERDDVLNNSFRNELGQDKFRHNLQSLLFGNFVTGCTVMMNPVLRPFFAEMPDTVRFHDGWMALAAFTFGEVREINEPMVRYRKHGSNLSIAADTKPRNRYRSTMSQLIKAFLGKDDFLFAQLEIAASFYDRYHLQMEPGKKACFQQFLTLAHKPYLFKKLAFRSMVKRFPISRTGLSPDPSS